MSVSYDKKAKRWRFKFERVINGQPVRATKVLPAGFSREDAEQYDREQTALLFKQSSGIKEKGIEDAVLIYCRERCPNLKRGDEIIKQLIRDLPNYAGCKIEDFGNVAARIRALPIARGTAQNRIAYVRSAITYAEKYHSFPAAPKIPTITLNNARKNYPTRGEILQIARKAHSQALRAIIFISLYSGLRQAEIMRCRLSNDGKSFVVHDTKNKTSHSVPVHPKLRVWLKEIPIKITQHTIKWGFAQARERAGLGQYRFHDIRHTAASLMVQAGVSLQVVGKVLNHKSIQSTMRYAHLEVRQLEDAIRKIG